MANNKVQTIFGSVSNALNANRRKKDTTDISKPGMGASQSMPNLDPSKGVEDMQQQFLDWQVHKISHDLYTRSVYYDTDRIGAYQDFRAMDGTPEIAAALNIIRDECVKYCVLVPLVCEEVFSIEELYEKGYINFEVYSYNPILKIQEPAICEKVVFKGEQDCYKVIFNDDSFVETTSEHLWLLKDQNKYLKTSELTEGILIESFIGNCIIKSIEYSGKYKTYDLVNVGEHNNFAVLTSDGKSSVFVHNCLTRGEKGHILEVYSENKRIKQVLEDLFKNVLNVDFNLRLWIRDLVKYGDYFVLLQISKEVGVYDFLTLPMEEVHREEGYDGTVGSVRFRWETTGDYFEQWQIAHFRLLEDTKKLPYGRSLLDSSRKLWKQLQLAEDAMLVYRLCLDGESRIRTDNGYKYIKDIKVGDKVVSYTDKGEVCFANVINQVNNGMKDVLKIASKHKDIICTKTHPILVNENGVIKYVDAQDLKVKKHQLINVNTKNLNIQQKKIDFILDEEFAKISDKQRVEFRNNKYENVSELIRKCVTEKYKFNRIKQFLYAENKNIPIDIAKVVCEVFGLNEKELIISNKGQINSERINLPKFVDEEFVRLFGFMLGDGCVGKNSIQFTGGVDVDQNNYYKNILEKYFSKVRFDNDNRSKTASGNYVVNSTYASKIFKNLDYICGAHNKRIPSWVFNSSAEIKKALILGLCDADGCIRYTPSGTWICSIEMCNKEILEDVKELWSSIGLSSGKLTPRVRSGHTIIENDGTERFIKGGKSFTITLTQLELPEYENIISIEEVEAREVYDISVDNEWHNFLANSLPVHNTRAPDRRVFYVEVGNLPDTDVKQYMNKMQNQVKKQPVVDARSGNSAMKYNPENVTEDFWIPIRGDKSSRIETLPGACLALDTKIDLLDGRSLMLSEIIEEYNRGKKLWSYSINPQSGEIVPGLVSWAGVTRKETDVVKITLDNDEAIICTPDHKFDTKFNGIKQAKDLKNEIVWAKNEFFNNEIKVVSVEFLEEKQDTGTLTIDGQELYHNFHNFALSVGVFTKNSNMDQIADIQFLQNKLFAALQVPKTYLNFGESMPGGSTLSQADIRFSRTINSIQEAILLELRRIANVHLYFLGFEDDLENFQLTLTNPSTQQELLKLETMKARLEVFKEYYNSEVTAPTSYTWAMENVLGFSKSDIKLILKQKKVEKKIFSEIESSVETYKKIGLFDDLDDRYENKDAVASAGNIPAETSGEGGGGGFSASSALGNQPNGIPGGSEESPEQTSGEPASEPTTEPNVTEPLSESVIKKLIRRSDKRIDNFVDELLGPDEELLKLMQEKEDREGNILFQNNKKLGTKTKNLLESLEKSINKIKTNKSNVLIGENVEYAVNSLVENSENSIQKTQELFDELDKITGIS